MLHQCENVVCNCDTAGESVTSDRSVNAPAEHVIAQLRAHRIRQFAEYLTENWPGGVTEECISEFAGTDCIELKLPEEMYCEACATYARICREWYQLPELQQRLSA